MLEHAEEYFHRSIAGSSRAGDLAAGIWSTKRISIKNSVVEGLTIPED